MFCFYKTTDVDDDDKQVTNAELQKSYLQGRNTTYNVSERMQEKIHQSNKGSVFKWNRFLGGGR